MKLEVGKFYRTENGRKAQIFIPDNGNGKALGAIMWDGVWEIYRWDLEGGGGFEQLISEWHEPVKYSVELWSRPGIAPDPTSNLIQDFLGLRHWFKDKPYGHSQVKYRVTVEEITEE